jgi:hypothetical protein
VSVCIYLVLSRGTRFWNVIQHHRGTVLKTAYGYTIESQKPDGLVETIDRMIPEFSLAAVPMGWVVDIVPALQNLPDGFPGTRFKKNARKWRKSIEVSAFVPCRFFRRQMAAGIHRPSYVSQNL